MAGFKFRMQSFLSIKEKIEEQKKLEYSHALKKLDEEKNLLSNLYEKKNNLIRDMRLSINSKIQSAEIKRFNGFIDFIKIKIQEQLEAVEKAQNFAEQKRLELVDSMKERKMLEVIKDNDKVEYDKEQLLKEQKIVDEIVSYQYNN